MRVENVRQFHAALLSEDFESRLNMNEPSVPVFDCHVLLFGPDDTGRFRARAANLDGVTGGGGSERQALLSIVTAFKAVVADLHRNNEPIPWKVPPDRPVAGEVERWIPVHL